MMLNGSLIIMTLFYAMQRIKLYGVLTYYQGLKKAPAIILIPIMTLVEYGHPDHAMRKLQMRKIFIQS